jgi:hypothetical protein
MLKKEEAIPWPGTLAIVHSYIAYKAGKVYTHPFSIRSALEKKIGKQYLFCFQRKS